MNCLFNDFSLGISYITFRTDDVKINGLTLICFTFVNSAWCNFFQIGAEQPQVRAPPLDPTVDVAMAVEQHDTTKQ